MVMTSTSTSAMQWRASIKLFDPTKSLSDSQLTCMLNALHLSASSFGMQPWKFFVISNKELRQQLREKSWNQPQITDCSHLIVLCRKDQVTESDIDAHLEQIAKTRNVSRDSVEAYGQRIKGHLEKMSDAAKAQWMEKQVYIALGSLLTAAAIERIDACPIEGFEKEHYDTLLNLPEQGYRSCVLCALGFRSPEDTYGTAKKVRFPFDDIVSQVP